MLAVIGSDFGRTNFCNAQSRKDDWPIGSFVVMEKHRRWTGRGFKLVEQLFRRRCATSPPRAPNPFVPGCGRISLVPGGSEGGAAVA